MDALQEQPELFQSYIAVDPSMWWDNKSLLNSFKTTKFSNTKFNNKSLYLGIANTLEAGMDTISAKKAKGPMVNHINSIFETRDVLRSVTNDSFHFKSKFYTDDSHGSAPLITTYDGLRFIFEFYQFEVQFSDVMKPNSDIVARMKAHYEYVSETLGYENKPNEGLINGMGYQLMEMNKLHLAGEFFKLNIAYYPKSYNVYDSLGDYYLATDNKPEAIMNFEKALALKENPGSRKKLEKLKSD
jgi:tetratricopeptide (TPR) repeat protein